MRPELLTPEGVLDPEMLRNVFALIEVTADPAAMESWTDLEMVLAYDWAAREHLHASDNPVQRRPKPSFVEAAEKEAVSEELAARGYGEGPQIHQAMRKIIAERTVMGATVGQLMDSLCARNLHPSRHLVQHWLRADEEDGLVTMAAFGRWKATPQLYPLVVIEQAGAPSGGSAAHHWDQLMASLEGSQQPIDQRLSIVIGTARKAISELRARITQEAS